MPKYIVIDESSANTTEYGIALFEGDTQVKVIPKLSPGKEDIEVVSGAAKRTVGRAVPLRGYSGGLFDRLFNMTVDRIDKRAVSSL